MNPTPASCPNCGAALPSGSQITVCTRCAIEAFLALDGFPEIDGYEIQRLAGEGAMGQIYLAVPDGDSSQRVAVKLVKEGLSTRAAERFHDEAQILRRLHHPNVAAIFKSGLTNEGRSFMVMEWLDALPLSEWRRRENPSPARIAEVMARICDGVEAAHSLSIVHRDLKPGNLMVSLDDKIAKVVDFSIGAGFSRAEEEEEPPAPAAGVRGTRGYMSPEQKSGLSCGPASDVFSLGIVLRECLNGEFPFPCGTGLAAPQPGDTGESGRTDPPAAPPSLPADLRAVMAKCLSPLPADRYRSAGGLAADLRNWLAGRLVTARPATMAYQLSKFAARNRRGVLLTSLVAGTGVFFGGWHLWTREQAARGISRQLDETRLVSAELASQRGQWDQTFQLLGSMGNPQAGGDFPIRATLALLEAQVAAGQRTEAVATLARLRIPEDGKIPCGLSAYWKAHLLEGTAGISEATLHLRDALAAGLPPVERKLAEAVLSDDARTAAGMLGDVVRDNPLHYHARALRSFYLLLSGNALECGASLKTALELFPKSAELRKYGVIISACLKGELSAEAETEVSGLRELVPIFSLDQDSYSWWWGPPQRQTDLIPGFRRYAEILSPGEGRRNHIEGVPSLALRYLWEVRRREIDGFLLCFDEKTPLSRLEAPLREETLKKQPNANLVAAYSGRYMEAAFEDESKLPLLKEACELVIADPQATVGSKALCHEIASAALFWVGVAKGRAELVPGAVEHARRRLEITQIAPSGMPAYVLGQGCLRAREYDLCRKFEEFRLKKNPADSDALLTLSKAEFEDGDFLRSVRLLRKIPADSPKAILEERDALLAKGLTKLKEFDGQ